MDLGVFDQVPNLSELILDENQLTNAGIAPGVLSRLPLSRLAISRNKFTEFPAELPESLTHLDLSSNQISFVSHVSMKNLKNLEILSLDQNKISDASFEVGALVNLKKLLEFKIGYNFLTAVPNGISQNLKSLKLAGNQIVYLRAAHLETFTDLKSIDLGLNQLKSVEKRALEFLASADSVDLTGNNWSCDCYLQPLKTFLGETKKNFQVSNRLFYIIFNSKAVGLDS